ncbi:hypothetical protein KDW_21530 [Dictyobacter vulcani]|uniref:Uncharacterized protein n=1 Tax=Dictyobacter vulcani TaxID=2607529 RepID=A0A5J4KNS0_9CHLR|nr:hypothetical protein [Dictyobacter vulcani]GER87991.1 hypothetical protein KDW_21530 [Dictyobacter vulcani]
MKIAVDIDGTLCWANLPVFLNECNTLFDLKIDRETLAKIESKQEFYALPEVQSVRKQNEYIERELAWIQFREKCLLTVLLVDDAVEGVAKLAQLGQLAYYTARHSRLLDVQIEIERATKQWLKQHHFINDTKVVFCNEIRGKVRKMVKLAKSDWVLLIDDNYQSIIEEINQLPCTDYKLLCEKLTLVAIHAETGDLPLTDLNVVALPYWDEIEAIIGRIPDYAKTTTSTKASKYRTSTKTSTISQDPISTRTTEDGAAIA